MAKFESSITINRPVEEVFAFAVDTAHAAKWQEGVIEATTTSSGAVGVGTTYRYVVQAMGQNRHDGEITVWQPKAYTGSNVRSFPCQAESRAKASGRHAHRANDERRAWRILQTG